MYGSRSPTPLVSTADFANGISCGTRNVSRTCIVDPRFIEDLSTIEDISDDEEIIQLPNDGPGESGVCDAWGEGV